MGDSFAKIVVAALVVVAIYNIVSSGNSANIISAGASGSASIFHSLEGK